ncbi:hypothetical protein ACIQVO_36265 [Streptomyces sp. NPDC101062]|uniref:hypothetical protein n=1 Tax=unclassified Streptomyces TaxID=2593676 RepID=UPI00381B95C0
MSYTRFQDAHSAAHLAGSERPWLHSLLHEHAAGVLLDHPDPTQVAAVLYELLPARHDLRHVPLSSGYEARRWLHVYVRCLIGILDDPVVEYRGHGIGAFTLMLNAAMESGGDALRLAARLHGQCEMHCWVDGPNREWAAGVITAALTGGLYRPDCGWEKVRDLLRERADLPVVVSSSDSFPTFWSSRSDDDADDPDEAKQRWEALQADEQWQRGMAVLHRRSQDRLEIRPRLGRLPLRPRAVLHRPARRRQVRTSGARLLPRPVAPRLSQRAGGRRSQSLSTGPGTHRVRRTAARERPGARRTRVQIAGPGRPTLPWQQPGSAAGDVRREVLSRVQGHEQGPRRWGTRPGL